MTDFQNFCYYSGPGWYHVELLHWCMYFETVNARGVKITKKIILYVFLKPPRLGQRIQLHARTKKMEKIVAGCQRITYQDEEKEN